MKASSYMRLPSTNLEVKIVLAIPLGSCRLQSFLGDGLRCLRISRTWDKKKRACKNADGNSRHGSETALRISDSFHIDSGPPAQLLARIEADVGGSIQIRVVCDRSRGCLRSKTLWSGLFFRKIHLR